MLTLWACCCPRGFKSGYKSTNLGKEFLLYELGLERLLLHPVITFIQYQIAQVKCKSLFIHSSKRSLLKHLFLKLFMQNHQNIISFATIPNGPSAFRSQTATHAFSQTHWTPFGSRA